MTQHFVFKSVMKKIAFVTREALVRVLFGEPLYKLEHKFEIAYKP